MKNLLFTPQVIDTACKIIKNDSLIPGWESNSVPTTFGYLAGRVLASSLLVTNFATGLIVLLMPVTNCFRFLTEMDIGNGRDLPSQPRPKEAIGDRIRVADRNNLFPPHLRRHCRYRPGRGRRNAVLVKIYCRLIVDFGLEP